MGRLVVFQTSSYTQSSKDFYCSFGCFLYFIKNIFKKSIFSQRFSKWSHALVQLTFPSFRVLKSLGSRWRFVAHFHAHENVFTCFASVRLQTAAWRCDEFHFGCQNHYTSLFIKHSLPLDQSWQVTDNRIAASMTWNIIDLSAYPALEETNIKTIHGEMFLSVWQWEEMRVH